MIQQKIYIWNIALLFTGSKWKKGILTDGVRDKAIEMIDSGFGLGLWAEAGKKTLDSRKKKLEEFKEKLLLPQTSKKKIKPNAYTKRIFADGDIIAVQLQTAGKPYTEGDQHPISEEEFHALNEKYVLMQLINCHPSWISSIVPEVKDYWARFRLFDGIYDGVPDHIDASELKEAMIHQGQDISAVFTCESSLFYFKRRNYKIICNRKDLIEGYEYKGNNSIFWGINKPWNNPDSGLVAAMGMQVKCCEYAGTLEELKKICRFANRYGRFDYRLSREENEARYTAEEYMIAENIKTVLANGGKLYSISFGREIGIVTVEDGRIDNLYIEGRYQRNGFGAQLLAFAFSVCGKEAYIDVPSTHTGLLHICSKIGLVKIQENERNTRFISR